MQINKVEEISSTRDFLVSVELKDGRIIPMSVSINYSGEQSMGLFDMEVLTDDMEEKDYLTDEEEGEVREFIEQESNKNNIN